MDDDEIFARFAGLRVALAYAIKAACRSPADIVHHQEALREIESLIPSSAHPAIREELDGVIHALTRMPVRDPSHAHDTTESRAPPHEIDEIGLPRDLLS